MVATVEYCQSKQAIDRIESNRCGDDNGISDSTGETPSIQSNVSNTVFQFQLMASLFMIL